MPASAHFCLATPVGPAHVHFEAAGRELRQGGASQPPARSSSRFWAAGPRSSGAGCLAPRGFHPWVGDLNGGRVGRYARACLRM
eukprot:5384727-Alexandrium_andersonii.AAC.1